MDSVQHRTWCQDCAFWPGGSWPGRGLGGRAAGRGCWRRVGGTGMGRGFAGSCSPRMRDQDPAGSPVALPAPPAASQRAQEGYRWGQSGGLPPPCTPSASLSLPRVHGLRPPCRDGDPLLLCQRPGGPHGVGVPLGVVIPLLEVSGASGGFAQGDQAGQGGLGGAQPWGHPLRLDADGLVLRGGAGGQGRLFGGDDAAADPGV